MPQKKNNTSSIVYSTDSNFNLDAESNDDVFIPAADQRLHVKLDKKHRGGKVVTIVEGYQGKDIEETGKNIKKFCGTGGSVKDGVIIIQGDNREKIINWLSKNNYKNVKRS